jgi:transposase
MVYGAIDLHMRFSQIRIVDAEGTVVRESRIVTSRPQLLKAFAGLGSLRILVEASTESEWVAQALEAAGHQVVVADPNFTPMYGERQRRIKTDIRDVAALAEANRRGWYRAVYRVSRAQRTLRQHLAIRRQLVCARTAMIAQLRALLRQEGLRLAGGHSTTVIARVARLDVPPTLQAVLAPLLEALRGLTATIEQTTRALTATAATDPVAVRLQTVPGVGPLVALTYRATVDDVTRFGRVGQVSSALGLVPRESSSGERRQRGRITKVGPSDTRAMLVQAAWCCWRSRAAAAS